MVKEEKEQPEYQPPAESGEASVQVGFRKASQFDEVLKQADLQGYVSVDWNGKERRTLLPGLP
jgi:hypothetical protein